MGCFTLSAIGGGLACSACDHVNGFAVRLHNLGDFYSVEYVELWRRLLERHSALHVWGYTARWQVKYDQIAAALLSFATSQWDRCSMRFSNAPFPFEAPSTGSVEHPYQVPTDAILCPEQIGNLGDQKIRYLSKFTRELT